LAKLYIYLDGAWKEVYTSAAPPTETDPVFLASEAADFVAGDKAKLDGIEASADVTDAANVAAAGAVMTAEGHYTKMLSWIGV
jgi:hypothetical protein